MAPRMEQPRQTTQDEKLRRTRGGRGITEHEVESVEEMSTPRTPVIYEVVRRQGVEEMKRPATSLWWSGIAGGLSMSFSVWRKRLCRFTCQIRHGAFWLPGLATA